MSKTKIFVVEHCENCQMHQWNTRHDAAQYKAKAQEVSGAIKSAVPDAEVIFNLVPKEHAMADIYCQLIPNDDETQPNYEVVPRIGSFEISINGVLLFSKCLSGCWPNPNGVSQKAEQVAEAINNGNDIQMFQTTGVVKKMKSKGPSFKPQSSQQQQQQEPAQVAPVQEEQAAQQQQVQEEPVVAAQPEPVQEQQAAPAKAEEPVAAVVAEEPKAAEAAPVEDCFKTHETAESLEDLKTFFKPDTNSAISRNLTQEIWDEYKDQACKEGVTFKTCCFSGVANQDSGIGLYAGSHDAYTTFNKLFDKVIKEYHGHEVGASHISDMNAEGLENAEFNEEDSARVNSTRIRVGRNVAGYPLGPGVTKEQRLEIMASVVKACETFEGDLQGKFYPLEGMDAATQQQLIDDHFLFKEGDRFLKACNLNRDWPSGRGIFHNDAKTFLVWVNEEDQLRIISMQPGAGIAEVFDRLSRAAKHIETICKFSHDDHLGYITSCPTNLGTALRASVHIKLPKLMVHKDQFNAIADKYFVQIRGIHGEHTETDDGVFDISNRRRLGRSERELVQDMINGVRALIDAEKAL